MRCVCLQHRRIGAPAGLGVVEAPVVRQLEAGAARLAHFGARRRARCCIRRRAVRARAHARLAAAAAVDAGLVAILRLVTASRARGAAAAAVDAGLVAVLLRVVAFGRGYSGRGCSGRGWQRARKQQQERVGQNQWRSSTATGARPTTGAGGTDPMAVISGDKGAAFASFKSSPSAGRGMGRRPQGRRGPLTGEAWGTRASTPFVVAAAGAALVVAAAAA